MGQSVRIMPRASFRRSGNIPEVRNATFWFYAMEAAANRGGFDLHSVEREILSEKERPGYDVSAYIDAARGPCRDYDIMLCLGESAYFHRAGWLKRFVDAWQKIGPGMYGAFSSNAVRGHLNTTGFCCPPKILAEYPCKIRTKDDRYQFEHGAQSLWRRTAARGCRSGW